MTRSEYLDLFDFASDHVVNASCTNPANGNKYAHEEIGEAIKRLTEAREALESPFELEED